MDELFLVPYDPRWEVRFEEEREWLQNVLPADQILAIEHFGSTAIAGMEAKPIIDILVAVPALDAARRVCTPLLEGLGYAFWADNPKIDRLFFVKGEPPAAARTHHVHLTEPEGALWEALAFRDYLKSHRADATRYVALKRELAARSRDDREAYTAEKSAFVAEIMKRAQDEGYLAPMLR